MKWIQQNTEVFKAASNIVKIDFKDISHLKNEVIKTKNRRIRICAHQNSDDALHEMLIVIEKSSYVRPHKHINKSESFHMIEGLLDVIIFDDVGNIREIISMGDPHSGKNFFYRLSTHYFHSLVVKTDFVVFHETTQGPFHKEDTIWAPWSPEPGHADEKIFIQNLKAKIDRNEITNG